MYRLLVQEGAPGGPFAVDRPFLQADRYRPVMCAEAKIAAILQEYRGIIGVAEFGGIFGNCRQDRADIGRRRSDDLEYVAAAGLVGQRLREVTGLGLYFLEQADI